MFGFLVSFEIWALVVAAVFGMLGIYLFDSFILGFIPFISVMSYLSVEGYLESWWLYAILFILSGAFVYIWIIPMLTTQGGEDGD